MSSGLGLLGNKLGKGGPRTDVSAAPLPSPGVVCSSSAAYPAARHLRVPPLGLSNGREGTRAC